MSEHSERDPDDPGASRSGGRRRADTWLSLLRRFSRLWGFLFFLLALVVLFRQVVLPFIFAMLVAYLLAPIIKRMEPRTGRGMAVILVYLVIAGILVAFFGFLLPALGDDLARLKDTAPELIARLNQDWLPRFSDWLERSSGGMVAGSGSGEAPSSELVVYPEPDGSYRVDLQGTHLSVHETPSGYVVEALRGDEGGIDALLRETLATQSTQLTAVVGAAARAVAVGVLSFLMQFLITFMLAAFILVDLKRVQLFIRSLIPGEYRGEFDEIIVSVDQGMAGVIRGQLLICLVNGFFTYVGLLIFGVKYSLLLGVLAAVCSLIPVFGTILSSAPIVLVALVSDPTGLAPEKAVAMVAWIAVIHLIEGNFLNPKIIGSAARIHPVIVVFALLAGESVYGLTGALLAVPVASMIQTFFIFARRRSAGFSTVAPRVQ